MEIKDIFKSANKIHIIGIGGVSMSAIAKFILNKGIVVSGSDINKSGYTQDLKNAGAKVYFSHNKNHLKNVDLVIYSLSIKDDNPELVYAKQKGIPCIKRGEALKLIASEYDNIIAVAGMHGKTTTTALIYQIFTTCGYNPTLHIGAEVDEKIKNIVIGDKDFFITEACEYGDSFLSLYPDVSVITNVEKEHLDYFKNLKNIYTSFNRFMLQSKKCFINEKLKQRLITTNNSYFGQNSGARAVNIKKKEKGYTFEVFVEDKFYGKISLGLECKHNINNCLAAICVANYYSLDKEKVIKAIGTFKGVKMRFEDVGFYDGHRVIFDYAHHPTEIKNSILAAQKLAKNCVYVYFQPHTYSRTKLLKSQFKKCFKGAESVFVCNTYKAREKYDFDGDEKALAALISDNVPCVKYGKVEDILLDIKSKTQKGILLFMGAGDMQKNIKALLKGF